MCVNAQVCDLVPPQNVLWIVHPAHTNLPTRSHLSALEVRSVQVWLPISPQLTGLGGLLQVWGIKRWGQAGEVATLSGSLLMA